MIRPASVGDIATMTRRPRATSPPRQCTVTLSAVCSISWTGTSSTMWSPTSAASRRRDLAGAADEPRGLRAALGFGEQLRRHAAGLDGEQQMQEGHLGGGHREDPDGADLQQGARHRRKPLRVIPGACGHRVPLESTRRLPGRFDRNVCCQHVKMAQHQLQFLQLRCEPGVKLVLPQHARAGQVVGRLALVVLRVGLDPEFCGQPEHPLRACHRSTGRRVRRARPVSPPA